MAAGRRWFSARQAQLARDGRDLEGGWPGTLPEARSVVRAAILPALEKQGIGRLTDAELELALRSTYAEARHAWQSAARRSTPPPAGSDGGPS